MPSRTRKALRAKTYAGFSGAEEEVFRHLERKWSGALKGNRIPKAIRRKMRVEPNFKALVQVWSRDGVLVDEDGDAAPRFVKNHDGSVVDRLVKDLGEDPAGHFCPECGDEKERGADLCVGCSDAEARFQN